MISGSRQPATLTPMPTIREPLGYVCPTKTGLRCAARINLHQHTPSFCRFVREFFDEQRPSGICHRFGKHPARQAFDVQIFNRNQTVLIDDGARNFVVEVGALVSDMRVRALQLTHGLFSIVATTFAPGNFTLRSPQFGLGLAVVARVLNLCSIAQSSESLKTDIQANSFSRSRQQFSVAFNTESDIPLVGFALHGDGFDLSFNRTMQLESDLSRALKLELTCGKQPAAVAIAGKCKAVIACDGAEARKSGFALLLFDAAKESFEVLVYTAQDILAAREVLKSKI